MKCSSKPYSGDKPYLFFSCTPADGAAVYPIIDRLCLHGYRVWFDDGSNPGESGLDVIADHLRKSSLAIAALTPASVSSHNFRNELIFRVAKRLPTILIFPQPMELSPVMELALSAYPRLDMANYPDLEKFYSELFGQQGMSGCLEERQVSREQYQLWLTNSKLYAQEESAWEEEPTMGSILITRWQNTENAPEEPETEKKPEPKTEPKQEPMPEPERQQAAETVAAPPPEAAPVPTPPEPAPEAMERPIPEVLPQAAPEKVPTSVPDVSPMPRAAEASADLMPIQREFERKRQELEAQRQSEVTGIREEITALEQKAAELTAQLEALQQKQADQQGLLKQREAHYLALSQALEKELRDAEEAEKLRAEAAKEAKAQDPVVDEWGEETVSVVSSGEEDFEATVSVARAAPKSCWITRLSNGNTYTISGSNAVIGRKSKLNPTPDVDLSDNPSISRRHAEIMQMGGRFWLRDNESAGGTVVDGNRVSPGGTAVLKDGSHILLSGTEELVFSMGAAPKPRPVEKLRCINNGEEKLLGAEPMYLDRSHRGEWQGQVLADPMISGKSHAILLTHDGKRFVLDERSTNGTFINGEPLPRGQERELRNRDLIKIGNVSFEYVRTQ